MKKCKIKFLVLALAVLSGAVLHKYFLLYKEDIDKFVREYGKIVEESDETLENA